MKKKLPKLLALTGGAVAISMLAASEFVVTAPAPPETEVDHSEHQLVASIDSLVETDLVVESGDTLLVPRTFVSDLPADLGEEPDVARKKKAFKNILLPLVLRANEKIALERNHILYLQDKMKRIGDISARDRNWLARMARRYGVRMGDTITGKTFESLLTRVDVVPPSLALAQGAIESGWGTSYFAQEGNALFGQWTWNAEDSGIVPKRREEGKKHRIKTFSHLYDSVYSYMTNLNRNRAYADMRARRKELRDLGLPITGAALAPTLLAYSERGEEYVDDLLAMINYNDFHRYDLARLEAV